MYTQEYENVLKYIGIEKYDDNLLHLARKNMYNGTSSCLGINPSSLKFKFQPIFTFGHTNLHANVIGFEKIYYEDVVCYQLQGYVFFYIILIISFKFYIPK